VMMPGMDGFGLLRKLRDDTRTRHLPVILVSARADPESTLGALALGADDYIVKPFSGPELLARVVGLFTAPVSAQTPRRPADGRTSAQAPATSCERYSTI
jgi:DNA-binding response OmpR family regulator